MNFHVFKSWRQIIGTNTYILRYALKTSNSPFFTKNIIKVDDFLKEKEI